MESEIATYIKYLTSKTIVPSNVSFVRKWFYKKEVYQDSEKQNSNSKPSLIASAILWFETLTGTSIMKRVL